MGYDMTLLMRMFFKYIICFSAVLVSISTFAGDHTPVIREQHTIVVDGVEEVWRLEWIAGEMFLSDLLVTVTQK